MEIDEYHHSEITGANVKFIAAILHLASTSVIRFCFRFHRTGFDCTQQVN